MDVEELYQASRFGEFEQALKALLVDPSLGPMAQTQVAARLGHYYRRTGAWGLAETIYRALETAIDDRDGCRLILARILRRAGRAGESLELFEQVLPALADPAAQAAAGLEAALASLEHGRPEQASGLLDQVADVHPGATFLKKQLESGGRVRGGRIIQSLVSRAEVDELTRSVVWRATSDWPPSRFRRLSHPAYMGPETVDDASFVVTGGQGQPVLLARLWRTPDGIEAGDEVVHLLLAEGQSCSDKQMQAAVGHIRDLCAAFGGRPLIADRMGQELGEIGRACLKHGFNAEAKIGLDIDLTRPTDQLWQGLRPSNHALIHRGREMLTMRVLDRGNPDWSLFEDLRQCHYRSVPTPGAEALFFTLPILQDEISAGRAELSIADRDGKPVGAVLILDDGPISHYGVARYPRDHEADLTSRFSLWEAILRAKGRGQDCFHLGHYAFEAASQGKLRAIADFKAGFTRARLCKMAWRVC